MDEPRLRQVFDRIEPSPAQKEAMFHRILTNERRNSPMKKVKKLPVLLAAAILLMSACAFTVMTGLDARILSHLHVPQEDAQLLSPSAVPLDIRMEDNGCTLELTQALADRYCTLLLMEFTAPEGTVLDGDIYRLDNRTACGVSAVTPDGTSIDGWFLNCTLLEDDDPRDNHITLLYSMAPSAEYPTLLGSQVTVSFNVLLDAGRNTVLEGDWACSFPLPAQDSGICYMAEQTIPFQGIDPVLTTLYLSPISVVYELSEGAASLEELANATAREWPAPVLYAGDQVISVDEENFSVHLSYKTDLHVQEDSRFSYRLSQIVDPAQITAVTLFGQTFALDGTSITPR